MTVARPLTTLLSLLAALTVPAMSSAQLVMGTGPGTSATVRVVSADGSDRTFIAYPQLFLGGVDVALGDINGDGVVDIVTGAGPGGGPHVRAWSGVDLTELATFYAYPEDFLGGVHVAVGDVNGDGRADIITGAGPGSTPHVRAWSGVDLTELASFIAYPADFLGGAYVAAGDINGDGRDDIITGAGPGGGPHMRVWSGTDLSEILGFFVYPADFSGGVRVAAGDVNGDGRADIITGAGPGGNPHVKVWSGTDLTELANFFAYDPLFEGGVFVGSGDFNGDGRADLITGAGPGGSPHVRIFNGVDLTDLASFYGFGVGVGGGVSVGSISPRVIRFTSANTTTFTVGSPGTFAVTTAGPTPTLTITGTLPAGVRFIDNGDGTATLAGTPQVGSNGAYTLMFTATRGSVSVTQAFTLIVNCAPLTVTPATLPGGTVNVAYLQTFSANGTPPHTFSVSSGTLPGGLNLTPATGQLAGMPAQAGTFSFTVTATDVAGCTGSVAPTLVITCPTITVSPTSVPNGTVGAPYSVTFTQTGATGSVSWDVSGGALPSGLTLGSLTGVLSGTPTAAGTFNFIVSVRMSNDACSASVSITLTVLPNQAPSFTSGPNQTVPEDSGPQTVVGWATAISPGPPSEAGQTVTFIVTGNTNPGIFSAAPAVSPTGTLTYTPASNATGTAIITLVLRDNGGTASGGVDTSAPQTFTITVTPVNDPVILTTPSIAYSTAGNTQLHVAGATMPGVAAVLDASGVLTKSGPTDIDGPAPPAVVPFSGATTNGTITLSADGSFTYVPNVGFTGVDSFTFQVTDSITPVSGTINVIVSERVWYVRNLVDANNPAGGNGRSTNAFETLAAAQTASLVNDIIFVFVGNTGTTPLGGGITLKNGQKLHGEGIGLTVPGFGTLIPAGSRPRIVNAGGNGVTVLANTANGDRTAVEIRGLDISSTNANAIDTTSSNTQNLGVRISENTISGSGVGQDGIDINAGSTGAATLAIHDNVITAGGTGLDIVRTAGTVTISAFDDNVVTGSTGGTGIRIAGGALPGVLFDAVPGGAFDTVAGGTTSIGSPGDPVGATGLVISPVAGDLSFADLDVFASATALSVTGTGAFTGTAGTRFTVGAGVGTVTATAGQAVLAVNITLDLQLATLSSTNSTGTGVTLTNAAGTFAAGPGSSISNTSGTSFLVSGGAAAVTYAGTISDNAGTNLVVSIANTTGGTKSFTGAITSTAGGISLATNSGATITFAGGLTLSTGANPAFAATGGGTINICDENPCSLATGSLVNTLTTTTGIALNVTSTVIGASNLEFRSISAGTAASGPSNGIRLNNTGSSGGLTVKGTGPAGSGGTIQNTTGDGISLTSTQNVSLEDMIVTSGDEDGIDGTTVTGFSIADSRVTDNGNVANEDGISFASLSGAVSITNTTVTGSAHNNLRINNTIGTISTLTISGGSFSNNLPVVGNHGVFIEARGTSQIATATISGTIFSGNVLRGIQVTTANTAIVSAFTISDSTITNNAVGIEFSKTQTSSLTFQILSNTSFTGQNSHGISLSTAAGAGTTGVFRGRIEGNTIGNAAVPNSGSATGNCISVNINGTADADILLDANVLRQCPNGRGIEVISRNGTGGLDVTLTSNDVNPNNVSGLPLAAIFVQSNCATVCNTVRADIRGNTVPAGSAFGELLPTFIAVVETSTSTLQLVDTAPTSATCTAQLMENNSGSASASAGCALIPGPINLPPSASGSGLGVQRGSK